MATSDDQQTYTRTLSPSSHDRVAAATALNYERLNNRQTQNLTSKIQQSLLPAVCLDSCCGSQAKCPEETKSGDIIRQTATENNS